MDDPLDEFAKDFRTGRLTAEQMLSRYCALVYRQTGSYEETARRLKIDRRTVKSKILAVFGRVESVMPPKRDSL